MCQLRIMGMCIRNIDAASMLPNPSMPRNASHKIVPRYYANGHAGRWWVWNEQKGPSHRGWDCRQLLYCSIMQNQAKLSWLILISLDIKRKCMVCGALSAWCIMHP